MLKSHLYFWIGVFVTILIGLPLAIGAWGIAEQKAIDVAVFAFGGVTALLVTLLTLLVMRSWVLKRLGIRKDASLGDLTELAANAIGASARGDTEATASHSAQLAKSIVAWYSWTSFYRWVISVCVALFVAFGAIAGSVLLFEQNRRIAEQTNQIKNQNDLISLQADVAKAQSEVNNLTIRDSLRQRLISPSIKWPAPNYVGRLRTGRLCTASPNDVQKMHPTPNPSAILSVERLLDQPEIREKVLSALESLTHDENPTVKLAALSIIAKTDIKLQKENYVLRNIIVQDFEVFSKGDLPILFINSFIDIFKCKNCRLNLVQSFLISVSAPKLQVFDSYIRGKFLNSDNDTIIANSVIDDYGLGPNNPPIFQISMTHKQEKNLVSIIANPDEYANDSNKALSSPFCLNLTAWCEKNSFFSCHKHD